MSIHVIELCKHEIQTKTIKICPFSEIHNFICVEKAEMLKFSKQV